MKKVIATTAAVIGMLLGTPIAHADDGTYLAYVRSQYPATVAGFSDFALLFGGHKACMTSDVASVAPGFPALSAAIYDAAHKEICP